jgi:hypothetical protein
MSLEFPNMNNLNPNEKGIPTHLTQAQIEHAAAEVEKSSLRGVGLSDYEAKPADKESLTGMNQEWVGKDFQTKDQAIKGFDMAGRHVVGEEQAQKAAESIRESQLEKAKDALRSLNSPQAQEVLKKLESENIAEVKEGKEMLKKYGFNEEGFTIN